MPEPQLPRGYRVVPSDNGRWRWVDREDVAGPLFDSQAEGDHRCVATSPRARLRLGGGWQRGDEHRHAAAIDLDVSG